MLRLPRGLALSPPGAGTAGARRLRCFTAMAMPLTRRAHLKRRVATAATFGEGVTGQASGGSQGQGSQGLDSGVAQALQERLAQAEVLIMRKEMEEREQVLRFKSIIEKLQAELQRTRTEVEKQTEKVAQVELAATKKVESQMTKLVKKAEQEAKENSKKDIEKLKAKLKDAEDSLKKTLSSSQRELADASRAAATDADAKVKAKLLEAKSAVAAAEARAGAAEAQLRSQTTLFEQLDQSIKGKQAAEALVATMDKEKAAQEAEANNLRQIASASSEKMIESQARMAASEASVTERVRSTITAAKSCIQAAEIVRCETEKSAAVAAEVAAAELAASQMRATAAEAKLVRQEELLTRFAETTAKKEAAETALVEAVQNVSALKAELQILRDAARDSEERAASATARANAAEAAVTKGTEKQLAQADERVTTAERKLKFVEETLAMQQEAAETEVQALKAALAAAQLTQEVETAAAKRLTEGMERILSAAELKAEECEARAAQAERALAFLQGALDAAGMDVDFRGRVFALTDAEEEEEVSPPWSRRLSANLSGPQIRALMASGPRASRRSLNHVETYRQVVQAEYEATAVLGEKAAAAAPPPASGPGWVQGQAPGAPPPIGKD